MVFPEERVDLAVAKMVQEVSGTLPFSISIRYQLLHLS